MATMKDITWIQRKLSKRCPHITVTARLDESGSIVVTGESARGSFTESSDQHRDTITAEDSLGFREQFYRAVVRYFEDLDADTARDREHSDELSAHPDRVEDTRNG
ncbi:hypothetical protein ACPPVW_18520 [Leifsonia sp. McL0607]|uniref:hypothetical protein n=1 Tax=Leifsonia sp. McL0607 TaxID=3415672 RepID=UPI003CEEF94A